MYINIKQKTNNFIYIIWPFGLIFMHFCLFRIDTFEFSIGTGVCLTIAIYLAFNIQVYSIKKFYIAISIICFFFIYTFIFFSFAENIDEFFKSLIQIILLSFIILTCSHIKLPHPKYIDCSINIFLALSTMISLIVMAQFISLNFFDSYALTNIYGPFSPLGPGYMVYEPHPMSFVRRPNGIFSEPSVAGWFLVYGVSVSIVTSTLRKKNGYLTTFICGIGSIATLSISAIINIVIVSLISIWVKSNKIEKFYFNTIIVAVIIIALGWVTVKANITSRFGNIFEEGTSIYYRLNAPLSLLSESLIEHPFGHPIGQVDYILSKPYMINWKYGSSTNIDNSFFMISYYYGFMGVFFTFFVFYIAIRLFFQKSHSAIILISLLLSLAETGSLWSPNLVLLIGYSIILIRHIRSIEHNHHINFPEHYSLNKIVNI